MSRKKKPPEPKPTGVLNEFQPGGPNFIEAYGWDWWRKIVAAAEAKGATTTEEIDGKEPENAKRQYFSKEISEDNECPF